ncbi:MAG: hydantoinase/oxoprolinase family protein, partial [Chloroflexi bacterium]|nr:hydantoinase/oxoprolinase family protein [Chloroflexota bacterium]
ATGRALAHEEVPDLREVAVARWADMRYVGQEHTVRVPWPEELDGADVHADIATRFRETYATRYGYSDPHGAVEIVALRVAVEGRSAKPPLANPYDGAGGAAEAGERLVYFEDASGLLPTRIYRREALPDGWSARGPAVVEEYASTTLVHPGCTVRVAGSGRLEIDVGGGDG